MTLAELVQKLISMNDPHTEDLDVLIVDDDGREFEVHGIEVNRDQTPVILITVDEVE